MARGKQANAFRIFRITIDCLMLSLFFYLMGYRVFRGLMDHAVAGITLFVLIFIHVYLNRAFYLHLFQGKYPLPRLLFAVIAVALLIDFVLMAAGSVMLSGAVFAFMPPQTQLGHEIHLQANAAGFLLISMHLGLHLYPKFKGWFTKRGIIRYLPLFLVLLLIPGVYCFDRASLLTDLLLTYERKPSLGDPAGFIMTYFGVLTGFAAFGGLLLHYAHAITMKRSQARRQTQAQAQAQAMTQAATAKAKAKTKAKAN